MATMLEVAKRAGVSKATVSRVLSGNGYVSQRPKTGCLRRWRRAATGQICWRATWRPKPRKPSALVVTNTLYHGVYFSELLYHVARMTEDKGGS